ncbi:hypothetical protein CWI38_2091p0010, partial [Hamiltosporidium tvaerminnensis]
MSLSLYKILNVKKTATKEEIELACEILIKEYSLHQEPDEASISKIIQAQNILCERIVKYLCTENIDKIIVELF